MERVVRVIRVFRPIRRSHQGSVGGISSAVTRVLYSNNPNNPNKSCADTRLSTDPFITLVADPFITLVTLTMKVDSPTLYNVDVTGSAGFQNQYAGLFWFKHPSRALQLIKLLVLFQAFYLALYARHAQTIQCIPASRLSIRACLCSDTSCSSSAASTTATNTKVGHYARQPSTRITETRPTQSAWACRRTRVSPFCISRQCFPRSSAAVSRHDNNPRLTLLTRR
jgi:hypothetical protein